MQKILVFIIARLWREKVVKPVATAQTYFEDFYVRGNNFVVVFFFDIFIWLRNGTKLLKTRFRYGQKQYILIFSVFCQAVIYTHKLL